MRIGVAGAGAVGCHYASLLMQAGTDVVCLAPGNRMLTAMIHMKERGLISL